MVVFDIIFFLYKSFYNLRRTQLKFNKYFSFLNGFKKLYDRFFNSIKNISYHINSDITYTSLYKVYKYFFFKKSDEFKSIYNYKYNHKYTKNKKKTIFFFSQKWNKFSNKVFKLFLKKEFSNLKNVILNFISSNYIPTGSRKRLYRFFQRRYKRLFFQIKRKRTNRNFFIKSFLIFFKKIKKLFLQSNNKNYLINSKDVISYLFFGVPFSQVRYSFKHFYHFNNRYDGDSFYPYIFFYTFRIDFFFKKIFPFLSFSSIFNNIIYNLDFKNSLMINYYDILWVPNVMIYYLYSYSILGIHLFFHYIVRHCYDEFFLRLKKIYYENIYVFIIKRLTLLRNTTMLILLSKDVYGEFIDVDHVNRVGDFSSFFEKYNQIFNLSKLRSIFGITNTVIKTVNNVGFIDNLMFQYITLENYFMIYSIISNYKIIYFYNLKNKFIFLPSLLKLFIRIDMKKYNMLNKIFYNF
jgi:hypothetical protein